MYFLAWPPLLPPGERYPSIGLRTSSTTAFGEFYGALSLALYWSFRSPYSYLVLPRIVALTEQFDVTVDVRIVHPAAIRNPAYFKIMNPLARPYFFKDTARMAQFLGMPFRRPVPDPIVQDPVTLEIAAEQPYVYRLGRLGIAAVRRQRGLD